MRSRCSPPATRPSAASWSRSCPRSLWATGYRGDVSAWIMLTIATALEQHERFDVIHSHVETPRPAVRAGLPDARCVHAPRPPRRGRDPGAAGGVSRRAAGCHQRRASAAGGRARTGSATIHHGLHLDRIPEGDGVRRLFRAGGPRHGGEGHWRGDRARRGATGRRCAWRPRSTTSRRSSTSRRSCGPAIEDGHDGVPRRGRAADRATRSMAARRRR